MRKRWAESHDFTERQNSRPKIRSNRRSFSLSLPISLFLAVLISLGGWLWLLGGGVLWLLYKILFDDDWTVSSWGGKEHRLAFKERPVWRMITFVPAPPALSRTISARHTCFCGALRSLTRASSRRRSAGKTVKDIPVRMPQPTRASHCQGQKRLVRSIVPVYY
jgi:hypothetical protein